MASLGFAHLQRVRELLRTPIEWHGEPWSQELPDFLVNRWRELCRRFQIGGEVSWFDVLDDSDGEVSEESVGSLEWDASTIETWIERARQTYISETRRLWQLKRPATRRHYAQVLRRVLELAVYPCRLIEAHPLNEASCTTRA